MSKAREFWITENPNTFDFPVRLQALKHRPRCEHVHVIEHAAYQDMVEALNNVILELGVPNENYPAPVGNAWDIATSALEKWGELEPDI